MSAGHRFASATVYSFLPSASSFLRLRLGRSAKCAPAACGVRGLRDKAGAARSRCCPLSHVRRSYYTPCTSSAPQPACEAVAVELIDHAAGKSYYPAYDQNGNVVALVNDAGSVAAAYEYSAFGELMRKDILGAVYTECNDGSEPRYDVSIDCSHRGGGSGHDGSPTGGPSSGPGNGPTTGPGVTIPGGTPDPNKPKRWSDKKCGGLAAQISQLKSAIGRDTNTISDLLASNPRASNYVMDALTDAKLTNNIYKLAMASPAFGAFMQSSKLATGIQGLSSGIGAFGLVANFYGLARGIEHHDNGQIVSSGAGIGLWGVMAVGGTEGSAVVLTANPWVAGAVIGTFVSVKGYEYYEDRQLDKAVGQTIKQSIGFLNRNVDSLAGSESLYSQHCR